MPDLCDADDDDSDSESGDDDDDDASVSDTDDSLVPPAQFTTLQVVKPDIENPWWLMMAFHYAAPLASVNPTRNMLVWLKL
jgi:hypothetical protein